MCGLCADEGWTGVTVAEFPGAGMVCSAEGVVWTDDCVEVEHEASMTHPVMTATGTTTRQRQSLRPPEGWLRAGTWQRTHPARVASDSGCHGVVAA